MIIANPLYDVVFKYLLEDIDIAKELLSTILGEEITHLEVKPQETATEMSSDGNIRIVRFDFKATIKSFNGEFKKVLIELQKLKKALDIMRFRGYLGDNYGKEDDVVLGDGTMVKMPLPIVTIYILGFPLTHLKNAVVKVNREYMDMLTGKVIENVKEDFIELLTHDSYVIQVRLLPLETKTKLDRILQIFNPQFKTDDKHKLDFTGDTNEPVVQKMLNRLQRAITNDEMRRKMDFEDEIERILEREAQKVSAEKDQIIAEMDGVIAEMDGVIAEKDGLIANMDGVIAEKDGLIANMDGVIAEKDAEIEALRQMIASMKK
jgi:hypothetical protein